LGINSRLGASMPVYATLTKGNFAAFCQETYRGTRIRQRNFSNNRNKRVVQGRKPKNVGIFAYSLLANDLNISKSTAWRNAQRAKRLRFIKTELIKTYIDPRWAYAVDFKFPPRRDKDGTYFCEEEVTSLIKVYKNKFYKPRRDKDGNLVYFIVS